MVLADNGDLVDASTYQPYGKMVPVITGTESVRERFTGKELDKEGAVYDGSGVQIAAGMGLQYFGARYYDAENGVWTSADPAEQYWNSYAYCGGDPINMIDPLGLYTAAVTYIMEEIVIQSAAAASQAAIAAAIANIAINIGTQILLNASSSGFAPAEATFVNWPGQNGYITAADANYWYQSGNGQALFADLGKIDFSRVSLSDFPKGVGSWRDINLDSPRYFSNGNDARVYGSLRLTLNPNRTVTSTLGYDIYDFDMQPGRFWRNAATRVGNAVAGFGTPYHINFYGTGTIGQ